MNIALIGGHLSPALAVLDALKPSHKVVFFGRKYAFSGDRTPTLEYQTITKRGIPFVSITTGRIQRRFSFNGLLSLAKIPYGFFQSVVALKRQPIDVVVGFGGYVSVPICLAAKTLGIPVVIHEQTLEAGIANKFISRFADTVCLSWQESEKYFKKSKTVVTGNPIKLFPDSLNSSLLSKISRENLPLLYITGGSTGSHGVNELIEKVLPELLERVRIIHQTGDAKEYKDFDRLIHVKDTLSENVRIRYLVQKFVPPEEVGSLMQNADMVVGRSGINTVTEILYFGKPALFIPLPYGQKNEQLKNAQFVKEIGLAEIVDQEKITPEEFKEKIFAMIASINTYTSHADKARSYVNPTAGEKVVEVLSYVAKKKTA